MAIRLHTAVGDEIREIARTDPEQAAEMRATSYEYAQEVMGRYDEEYDPYDQMEDGHEDRGEPEQCDECGNILDYDSGDCPNQMCPTNDGTNGIQRRTTRR